MNDALHFPVPPFEAALMRAFGSREELRAILLHAMQRGADGLVCLTLMPDDTLWLIVTRDPKSSVGAVLLEISVPAPPVSSESLALRADVIDWRSAAHAYDALLARRAHRPMP